MCSDTHTEAGRVWKNSTKLEFLKAAAGITLLLRDYKKRSKAGYKQESKQHYAYKQEVSFFFISFSVLVVQVRQVKNLIITQYLKSLLEQAHSVQYVFIIHTLNSFSMVHVYGKGHCTPVHRSNLQWSHFQCSCKKLGSSFLPVKL